MRLSIQKEYPSFYAVYGRVEGPLRSIESDPSWKPTMPVMRLGVRRFRTMTDVHGEERKERYEVVSECDGHVSTHAKQVLNRAVDLVA